MANDGSQTLLTNLAANGETPCPWKTWHRGRGQFDAWGTFGGGSLSLYYSPDDGVTWIGINDANGLVVLTANGSFEFDCAAGPIKAVLTGATTPNVSAKVNRI